MQSSHWAKIGEAGFLSGMKLMFAIYHRLGRWPFRLVLYPVLAWYVLTNAIARHASKDYLTRLHRASAGHTPPPTLANIYRHFTAFAEMMLDKLLVWSGDLDRVIYAIENPGVLRDRMAAGQGAVIVTAHIGNAELCRVLAREKSSIRLNVLVHTPQAQRFNQLMRELNPASQIDLIQVSDISAATAMLLAERVEAGEFVVIAGDRVPLSDSNAHASGIVEVDFLGAAAPLPFGPYLLASLFKCPLIGMIACRRNNCFHITLATLAERVVLPRQNRRAAAAEPAQAFAAMMAKECSTAPFQWFNFFPFWTR
ncbi:LpxL/LpxP family acyltransferase [Andreprevotia chitinilytica]|uniref:LpxL/LpxP family acyltransferase n=1 Tax=Andreprevotia chitinilytica TaxID=396808 RepID=UPI0005552A0C|nr:acyltransferase [Andreprevotia chitinilytica]